MKSVHSWEDGEVCGGGSPRELYSETVRFLDEAMSLEPNGLEKKVDEAERKVVKLRDCLIERLRKDSERQSMWRKPLDRVNVALSLIAAVEYPATGIHRTYMEDAQKVLRDMELHLPH